MKVDEIIRLDVGQRIRVYRVTGIYLGSAREEDVIGIECLDMYPATHDGKTVKEMLVPRHIIELVVSNENRIVPMPLDVQERVSGSPKSELDRSKEGREEK